MSRPLVTFFLISCEHERFVDQAVAGVLAQDYAPLDLIFSDDASQDQTFERIQAAVAAYRGPHRIQLNRNPTRLGVAAHINKVMSMAKGRFIVCASADDVSLPRRTRVLVDAWERHGSLPILVQSAFERIDGEGKPMALIQYERKRMESGAEQLENPSLESYSRTFAPFVYGCAAAWSPELFGNFGPLPGNVVQEDVALGFRSCLMGGMLYLAEPLMRFRAHGANADNNDHSLLASGRAWNWDQFQRLERMKVRRLQQRGPILDGFIQDLTTAEASGRISSVEAQRLRMVIQREKDVSDLQLKLRTSCLAGRWEALNSLRAMRAVSPAAYSRLLAPRISFYMRWIPDRIAQWKSDRRTSW